MLLLLLAKSWMATQTATKNTLALHMISDGAEYLEIEFPFG